ncbi:hypothetical protein LAZ67_13000466 [Cordylochernes scorpioides]|uniref:Uncharacterized protein n=1 Tax=Cordylochernes scorpioides TaxID=51811 RepID=A0ABY6L4U6_9ARAC|nr:hypothetical protein LAZ67_13000466 [Cordylochernes scorpioides]
MGGPCSSVVNPPSGFASLIYHTKRHKLMFVEERFLEAYYIFIIECNSSVLKAYVHTGTAVTGRPRSLTAEEKLSCHVVGFLEKLAVISKQLALNLAFLLFSSTPTTLGQSVLRRCKKTSTYVSPRDAAERDLGCTGESVVILLSV